MAAMTWEGKSVFEFPLPRQFLGHATACLDSRTFLLDGISQHVSMLHASTGQVVHLCRHDSDPTLRDQDAHVHPIITPRGSEVIFTSDRAGKPDVYEVGLQEP